MDNSILLNSSVSDEDPAITFYNNKVPTIESFNQIKDEDKLKTFQDLLANAPEDDYLTHLVFAILKLSSISDQSPEAKLVTQQLFKDAFEYGKNKDRVSFEKIKNFVILIYLHFHQFKTIRNFFLIQLGLLKSEDKFKPKYNLESCRSALASAIKENSLPDEEKSIFEHFLNASK